MNKSNDTILLEEINKLTTVEEIKNYIIMIYKSYREDKYIPTIIQEGVFTAEKGSDFYLKLILKHVDVPITQTWMKGNLCFGLEEPKKGDEINFDAFIHNVIVWRNYESKNLYQINPNITRDIVTEFKINNTEYINAKFNEGYGSDQNNFVLKKNPSDHLMVLKSVLQDYINEPDTNVYPKYELVAEFEYRTHENNLVNQPKVYSEKEWMVNVEKNESVTVVIGSIKIPFIPYERTKMRDIQVIDINTLQIRAHNPNDFTGDREAGFIVFNKAIIEKLRVGFYFYDLSIIDKNNIEERYMIDVLDDKVVFWESEYNKLPEVIKNQIDLHNIKNCATDNIISQAMYEWQLMASWSWAEYLNPSQKLANIIAVKYFTEALQLHLTFIEPNGVNEMMHFINTVEKITNIKLEKFNKDSKDVSNLLKIKMGEDVKIERLDQLYEKYCYAVWRELNDE